MNVVSRLPLVFLRRARAAFLLLGLAALLLLGLAAAPGAGAEPTPRVAAPVAAAAPTARRYPPVQMRYRPDAGPTGFASAQPWNYDDPMLWKGVSLERDEPAPWPLGYGSVVVWEGGTKVFLDRDSDGRRRTRLKAIAGVEQLADIEVRYPGSVQPYRIVVRGLGEERFLGLPVRFLRSRAFPLRFARACHREGRFQGQRFALIDDSLNGRYDDFGEDTVRIGDGPIQPLSQVMRFGSRLYHLERVRPDGTTVLLADYEGPTGRLRAEWRGAGAAEPAMLVFRCVRGEFVNAFFNLAGGEPSEVPAGHYALVHGVIKAGAGRTMRFVRIGPGRSRPVAVAPGQTVVHALGAPCDVEAGVEASGDGLRVPGRAIRIFGAGGEEYYQFYPASFDAEVSVRAAGGPVVLAGRTAGRPEKADADRHGMAVMWYPKAVEFGGSIRRGYEAKVDVRSELLGRIEGRWHRVEVLEPGP
ncbi:MAG: hypothetical protein JXQ29_12420 [Planctomycetes bacterium]|nr:hypothetical protein [Planctomycetota bacterium]